MAEMIRVRKDNPCPVCGRPDWCLIAEDGSSAICQRVESPIRKGGAGYLHRLSDNPVPVKYKPRPKKQEPAPDFFKLTTECRQRMDSNMLQMFSEYSGLSVESLKRVQVGFHRCYGQHWHTFPMRDGLGKLVGIRLRNRHSKKSVKGSKNALFWPVGVKAESDNLLFIPEGPTDTAALLDLGFDTIGRASCGTGLDYLKTAIEKYDRKVVIVADKDEAKKLSNGSRFFPGYDGAKRLAEGLKKFVRHVRVIISHVRCSTGQDTFSESDLSTRLISSTMKLWLSAGDLQGRVI